MLLPLLIALGGIASLTTGSFLVFRGIQRHYRKQAQKEVKEDPYAKALEDPDYRAAIEELNILYTDGQIPETWHLDEAKKRWSSKFTENLRAALNPKISASTDVPPYVPTIIPLYSTGPIPYNNWNGGENAYCQQSPNVYVAPIDNPNTLVLDEQEQRQVEEQCKNDPIDTMLALRAKFQHTPAIENGKILEPAYSYDEPDRIIAIRKKNRMDQFAPEVDAQIEHDGDVFTIMLESSKVEELVQKGIDVKEYIGHLRGETQNWSFLPMGVRVEKRGASLSYELSVSNDILKPVLKRPVAKKPY